MFLTGALGIKHQVFQVSMLALLPEDKKPGCLFKGLFLERLPVKMRDHLVSREFKNPSEMVLYANSLWDPRKAIPTDHLLAAASTTSFSPSCGRAQDRRSPSPNRRSQTPGPSNSPSLHFMPQDLKFGHHQGSEEKSRIEIFPSKMLSSIL